MGQMPVDEAQGPMREMLEKCKVSVGYFLFYNAIENQL